MTIPTRRRLFFGLLGIAIVVQLCFIPWRISGSRNEEIVFGPIIGGASEEYGKKRIAMDVVMILWIFAGSGAYVFYRSVVDPESADRPGSLERISDGRR